MIAITGLKDLEKFGKQAIHASEKIESDVNDVKKAVAGFVFLKVMQITSVDTSKAISNWKIRTPNDQSFEREAYFEGDQGSTRSQSFQAVMMNERPNLENAQPGKPIFISNNLDYVEDYLLKKNNLLTHAKKTGDYRAKEQLTARLKTRGGYFK
mgnify:CR=1 FL=1|tara:strand:- start:1242 stop:1703 length:462 start_codon:yes stop_codon:yes gene_type:complete